MSTNELGPLVRLWGMRAEQLPAPTATGDELAPLLTALVQEAAPFIDTAAPKDASAAAEASKLWKRKGAHSHADSAAKVEVLERVVPASDLARVTAASSESGGEGKEAKPKTKKKPAAETWCCRRSVHADRPEKGTASWAEFDRCFRERHAESERAFTPACVGAHAARRWECGSLSVSVDDEGAPWTDFALAVVEMRHRIGRPVLKDRTFPVLQMTCRRSAGGVPPEFLVVSVPVPDFGSADATALAAEKGAQVAAYVSVERIRKTGGVDDTDIEWLMATASDAGGVLPAWVQNLAAPGVIWKDVPLFLGWIARERQGSGEGDGADENGDAAPAQDSAA
ncbi:hypothetical protein GGR52DRAFT_589449 [Hypoxylon sp. FL1284]|nr:hypothetical protein GGR52DRAFT_589449 [Hypoxylon sp. FL1284]